MEKFFEKNHEMCNLVQLNVLNRENDLFLFQIFFESEKMPENVLSNTSLNGIICSSKSLIEKQQEIVENNTNIQFAIFYDFDFNTFKITASKTEMKIQNCEWMSEIVGVYSFICWPRTELEKSEDEIKSIFRGKKCLYVNEFVGPLNYVCEGNQIKIVDKNQKDNNCKITEVKKYQMFKATNCNLKNLFVFNVEMWSISENDGQPSQIIDFVKVKRVFADKVEFVFVDDFAVNHVSILEKFMNEFSQSTPNGMSTLTTNYRNKLLLKSEKTSFDNQTWGSSPRLQMRIHSSKLRNVHFAILNTLPLKKYLVDPNYIYFHYSQDNAKDDGWGCAYRSLQTIVSWFVLNGQVNIEIPSIEQIQQTLVDIGDKSQNFVGSNEWIGSTEISYVLHKLIGIDCQILSFNSGSVVVNNLPKIKQHFETVKTPVMIGGSVLAWTLLGIAMDEEMPQNSKFLILDPHYKGKDEFKLVTNQKNKAVYWADAKIFKGDAFYNFCCPLLKN